MELHNSSLEVLQSKPSQEKSQRQNSGHSENVVDSQAGEFEWEIRDSKPN